jgi:hypothetical protein
MERLVELKRIGRYGITARLFGKWRIQVDVRGLKWILGNFDL